MMKRTLEDTACNSKKLRIGPQSEEHTNGTIPLSKWRIVMTGVFSIRPRSELESTLKSNDVVITAAVSSKTTHLIIGNSSGTNEFGKPTGVGSSKHRAAVIRSLPIVSEAEIWSLLTNTSLTDRVAEVDEVPPPLFGNWLGLKRISEKKSKSGRARCRGCDHFIEKGDIQLRMGDESLFSMVALNNGWYTKYERNFVKTAFPGFSSIGRVTFFVHGGCIDEANEKRELQFDNDWAKIRGYILNREYYQG